MFQFMFMVQLLVKFRFFIQELWERKSTNIVWMLTTGVSCALGTAVYLFYWWWKLCFIISQNSQVKIFYIKFKPNFTGIVLNTLFNMTYIWQPSPSFKMVWLYPETQVSSTNKTCRHDITETLLLVALALNTITLTTPPSAPHHHY